jgi:urease accessory protein
MRDILTLSQWLSPAFPVGAFAFSHGLESAIRDELVTNAAELEAWLHDLADAGSLRSDVVLVAAAHDASDLVLVQEYALAFQPSAERLEEAVQLGAAFCRTVRDVWGLDLPDLAYPVAVGRAARLRGIALEDTAALYSQAFFGNLVSAAIRLVPLGQTEGQGVLARLQPACRALGEAATELTLEDLASASFLSDIQSMRHETLSPRIFQS